MKKEMKSRLIILGIILLAGLFLYFGLSKSLTLFPTSQGTEYSSYKVSEDGKTLTYSGLYKYQTFQGLTEVHYLSDEVGGQYFPGGQPHQSYSLFYLALNGLDANKFLPGGNKPLLCTFTPKDWQTYATNCYYDESDRVTYCGTGDYWGSDYQQLKDLGFVWNSGKISCFSGNYKLDVLRSNLDKVVCSVKGDYFDIPGSVGVTNTGFYCRIDPSAYPNLGSVFEISKPEVEFRIEDKKIYYRFENNQCTQITLFEFQKTSNDFESDYECYAKIVQEEVGNEDNGTMEDQGGETEQQNTETSSGNAVLLIIGLAILVIILIFVYIRTRNR